jgi:hypothetical protein
MLFAGAENINREVGGSLGVLFIRAEGREASGRTTAAGVGAS